MTRATKINVPTGARVLDLGTIDEIDGQLGEAERLLHALAKLIDTLEDKEERGPLLGVAYAAIDKIKAVIELVGPEPAKAGR